MYVDQRICIYVCPKAETRSRRKDSSWVYRTFLLQFCFIHYRGIIFQRSFSHFGRIRCNILQYVTLVVYINDKLISFTLLDLLNRKTFSLMVLHITRYRMSKDNSLTRFKVLLHRAIFLKCLQTKCHYETN